MAQIQRMLSLFGKHIGCRVFFVFLLCWYTGAFGQLVTLPDTNFRNYLKIRFPNTIHPNGQLIVMNANNAFGSLDCRKRKLESVEGLQYFVNLTDINLDTNNLRKLPNLSNFKNLQTLSANFNKLDSLPDLSKLFKLVKLNVGFNNLKSIPNLDKLTNLQTFFGRENQLESLPNLDKLTNINSFNVAYNNLKAAPYFGENSRLTELHLFNNYIDSLPNYSNYFNLTYCWVHNNNLTFKDVLIFKPLFWFPTFFCLPQRPVKVGKKIQINEGETLSFATRIDTSLADVEYEWHKVGKAGSVGNEDVFTKENSQPTDSGRYYCIIKLPNIFNVHTLQTDTFVVTVTPCFDLASLSIFVTETNCTNTGTVVIKNELPPHLSLQLTGASGKTFNTTNGIFTGLTEATYQLTASPHSTVCGRNKKTIAVPTIACKDFLVTPDNDGQMDSFFFSASGTVKIFDKRGVAIKEMKIPGEWDCTTDHGKVPIGYYIAYINDGESQIGLSVMY